MLQTTSGVLVNKGLNIKQQSPNSNEQQQPFKNKLMIMKSSQKSNPPRSSDSPTIQQQQLHLTPMPILMPQTQQQTPISRTSSTNNNMQLCDIQKSVALKSGQKSIVFSEPFCANDKKDKLQIQLLQKSPQQLQNSISSSQNISPQSSSLEDEEDSSNNQNLPQLKTPPNIMGDNSNSNNMKNQQKTIKFSAISNKPEDKQQQNHKQQQQQQQVSNPSPAKLILNFATKPVQQSPVQQQTENGLIELNEQQNLYFDQTGVIEEGNFVLNDIVEKILIDQLHFQAKLITFQVFWAKRPNGIRPKSTIYSYESIKRRFPYRILLFWEDFHRAQVHQYNVKQENFSNSEELMISDITQLRGGVDTNTDINGHQKGDNFAQLSTNQSSQINIEKASKQIVVCNAEDYQFDTVITSSENLEQSSDPSLENIKNQQQQHQGTDKIQSQIQDEKSINQQIQQVMQPPVEQINAKPETQSSFIKQFIGNLNQLDQNNANNLQQLQQQQQLINQQQQIVQENSINSGVDSYNGNSMTYQSLDLSNIFKNQIMQQEKVIQQKKSKELEQEKEGQFQQANANQNVQFNQDMLEGLADIPDHCQLLQNENSSEEYFSQNRDQDEIQCNE